MCFDFLFSKASQTSQASILMTTKGDVVETWKLILKGRIVTDDDFYMKNSLVATSAVNSEISKKLSN